MTDQEYKFSELEKNMLMVIQELEYHKTWLYKAPNAIDLLTAIIGELRVKASQMVADERMGCM